MMMMVISLKTFQMKLQTFFIPTHKLKCYDQQILAMKCKCLLSAELAGKFPFPDIY